MPVPSTIRISKYILGLAALIDLAVAAALTSMRSGLPERQSTILIVTLCLLANALWAFITAMGLARFRRWARISVLLRGAIYFITGILGTLAEIAARLLPSLYPISVASRAAAYVLAAVALVFPAIAIIGLWWLIYFSRRSTRALFRNTPA